MEFSVLIPTLDDRRAMLDKLMAHFNWQIEKGSLQGRVEIVVLSDQKQMTTGKKRNLLLAKAKGKYCAFVDDDDWVSDNYLTDVLHAVSLDVDCVGFFGTVTFGCEFAGNMVHSIMCPAWTEGGTPHTYYRPPNHLNPVRTDYARRIQFRDIVFSEDHFWSLDLKASKLLKREVFLGNRPTYFYRCRSERKTL